MAVNRVGESLYNIYLDQEREGFKNFISTWLYKDDELCFIVDPGPTSTIKRLKSELEQLEVEDVNPEVKPPFDLEELKDAEIKILQFE